VKDFYNFYLKSYIYNLKGSEKKVFKLTSAFGANFFELKKDDFATEKDIRIKVKAKSEIEEERNKYKNDLY
jgi:inorganic pyrophosphatase